jgi:predicted cytidylate kinase
MNITITGDLGSGKSSVAKELCKKLNFKYFSTGNVQRQIGAKKGMNTLELNYFSEKNLDIDKYIDDLVREINNNDKESYVLDSRMAWHFIEKSLKIYLTVNPIVAAERVNSDNQRTNEPIVEDINKKSLNLLERRAAEDKRFKNIYGVDCSDLNNYDLVIDTTYSNISEIADLIINLYNDFLNKNINKYWVSPISIYPIENIRKLAREDADKIRLSVNKNGFDLNSIIEVVDFESDLYIWDGHKRVSAAILNKISLIPIDVLAKNKEEIRAGITVSQFIATSLNSSWLYDWEDYHNFLFKSYPKLK